MTNEEVKFLLSAAWAGEKGSDNEAVAEALRQAQTDPVLRSWLEASVAFDSAIVTKLGEVGPPDGLRDKILAGGRVTRPDHHPLRYWFLAAAAGFALAAGIYGWRLERFPIRLRQFAQFVMQDTATGRFGGRGLAANELQARLEAGGKLPSADSIDFAKLELTGCRIVHFDGRTILEVCFDRDGLVYHFYVAPKPAGGAPSKGPVFVADSSEAAAVWSDVKFDYALTTRAGIGSVRKLF